MYNMLGNSLNKMGAQFLLLLVLSAAAYVFIYIIIFKVSKSKELSNLIGGMAFLATFYLVFLNIFLPEIQMRP